MGKDGNGESVAYDAHCRLISAAFTEPVAFYGGQEVVSAISPSLLGNSEAIDILAERLVGYAVSMIESEARRRSGGE